MRDEMLSDILGAFPDDDGAPEPLTDPITVWYPAGTKARYDKLQRVSGRAFSRIIREVALRAIELAEERAS